jgi:hypothetical protein
VSRELGFAIDMSLIADRVAKKRGITAEDLGKGIIRLVQPIWRPFADTFADPFPEDPEVGRSVCSILYVGRSQRSGWSLNTIRFPFRQRQLSNKRYSIILEDPRVIPEFDGPVVDVQFKPQGRRDCLSRRQYPGDFDTDSGAIRVIDQMYADAIQPRNKCSEEIGGPIDIAKLTQSECRWLRRKS